MNQLSDPHQAIRNLINPAAPRRALVVEGKDDKEFIEHQLDVTHPGWNAKWVVGPAEGKNRVLDILKLEPSWLGLVDTDEWQPSAVQHHRSTLPALHFLPRYCMESYFIVPVELWAMLPAGQQALIPGGQSALEAAITAPLALAQWVRHGVLWQVVNPLWAGLKAKGFKDALLDLGAAQNDQFIQTKLQEWNQFLDARSIYADFQTQLTQARSLTTLAQLTDKVHGKSFFRAHVSVVLNHLLNKRLSASDWLTELTKNIPAHPDFRPLWTAMQLP